MNILISVYDKTGIVEFASELQKKYGATILSTGGTLDLLEKNGLTVTAVEEYTGFPEMMDGRVKTLHPRIHGGILSLRDNKEHMEEALRHNIDMIDMVVVNLYPFEEVVARGADFEEVIENIDIGGPSMLRSAAKNHKHVVVVPSPAYYSSILEELKVNKGKISEETRKELAREVFWKTAKYDEVIARYLSEGQYHGFFAEKISNLRYGENPHMLGFVWRESGVKHAGGCISSAKILHGKEMSFLNYYDADAALAIVREFEIPAVAFIKHANPCGVGADITLLDAFRKGYASDPRSAFGVIIAMNKPCGEEIAEEIEKEKMFVEVLIAPSFSAKALTILEKKKNLRLLEVGNISALQEYDIKKISGGFLTQSVNPEYKVGRLQVVTKVKPTDDQMADLEFAWKVVKHVKSNAIVLAKAQATVGIGAGQMSRVDSVEIAVRKSEGRSKASVLASDAFFPFADNIDEAHKAGVKAIIQPGGSVKDDEVVAKCDKYGIAMVFTGMRVFKH